MRRASGCGALLRVAPSGFEGRVPAAIARLLGCEPASEGGPRPIDRGSKFPGFEVTRAEEGRRLELAGRHRFSRYELVFTLGDQVGGTRLAAETWAAFPGARGRAYRAAVIGSRGHVVVVRRMPSAVARRSASVSRVPRETSEIRRPESRPEDSDGECAPGAPP